jgi:hypothetical protein
LRYPDPGNGWGLNPAWLKMEEPDMSPSQSLEFYDELQAASVPVKNAGHGLAPTGGAIIPTRADLAQRVANFFDTQLQ